jgi:hypothetical protein
MANVAETLIDTENYNAKKRNWEFEKFVMVHNKQHSVLTGLMQFDHVDIDEASKVRRFQKRIKSNQT